MHHCDTLLLACMDFRLHPGLYEQVRARFGTPMDLLIVPGAAKGLLGEQRDFLLDAIATAVRLHGIRLVVLASHCDCGAYGGKDAFDSDRAEKERHMEDLGKAKAVIEHSFPGLTVETMMVDLSLVGGEWRVSVL